jgi:HD superfamily phosphohydrolase
VKFTRYLRDPIHGKVGLTETEYSVLGSVEMQRTNRLRQLGLVHHVYPGATHTRLSHSIGTLAATARILKESGLDEKYDSTTIENLRLASLVHEGTRSAFGQLVERHFATKLPHREAIRTLVLEGQMREYWLKHTTLPPDEFHDASFIFDILGADRCTEIALILDRKPKPEYSDKTAIINGPLGAHTLDFIRRDSYFVGLPHVAYDEAIFSGFELEEVQGQSRLVLRKHPVVLSAAADVLYARWYLYRHVFLHHAVLTANAMLVMAMRKFLREWDMNALYVCGDDDVLMGIATGRGIGPGGPALSLETDAHEGRVLATHLLKRNLFKRVYSVAREMMAKADVEFPDSRHPEVEAGLLERCRRYEPRALLAFPAETPAYDDSDIAVFGGGTLRSTLSELELETIDRYDEYYKKLDRLYVIVPPSSLHMRQTIQGGLATFLPPNDYRAKPFIPSIASVKGEMATFVARVASRRRRLAKYLWVLCEEESAEQKELVKQFGVTPSMVSQDFKEIEELLGGPVSWLRSDRGATKKWSVPIKRHRDILSEALRSAGLSSERPQRTTPDDWDGTQPTS